MTHRTFRRAFAHPCRRSVADTVPRRASSAEIVRSLPLCLGPSFRPALARPPVRRLGLRPRRPPHHHRRRWDLAAGLSFPCLGEFARCDLPTFVSDVFETLSVIMSFRPLVFLFFTVVAF